MTKVRMKTRVILRVVLFGAPLDGTRDVASWRAPTLWRRRSIKPLSLWDYREENRK